MQFAISIGADGNAAQVLRRAKHPPQDDKTRFGLPFGRFGNCGVTVTKVTVRNLKLRVTRVRISLPTTS